MGVTIHQDCAVRGIDTTGGRVVGCHHRARADRGGCRALRRAAPGHPCFVAGTASDLPQAGMRSTIFCTTPAAEVTPGGLVTPDFTISRRLDGGYIVAAQNRGQLEVTPQGLRYARQFWPTFQARRKSLRVAHRALSFFDGPEALPANGRFDKPTPFERHRIFAPPPDLRVVEPALKRIMAAYPALARDWHGADLGRLDRLACRTRCR